uniref:Uncharacterized protein n=1 Tax=Cucumis melo TaxID=3656 RepID=A0A9I9D0L5_CUCME
MDDGKQQGDNDNVESRVNTPYCCGAFATLEFKMGALGREENRTQLWFYI